MDVSVLSAALDSPAEHIREAVHAKVARTTAAPGWESRDTQEVLQLQVRRLAGSGEAVTVETVSLAVVRKSDAGYIARDATGSDPVDDGSGTVGGPLARFFVMG